ncbi:MAG: response regulator transcription factor [Aquabacterium sp.]
MHIAIIEDDPDQLALMLLWAESVGHQADGFADAMSFKSKASQSRFDLLLVDWMLPDSSGQELMKWIRHTLGWDIPVLVVTACDDEPTIVTALDSGADDYLVKPPKPKELAARVTALGRRIKNINPNTVTVGDYCFDTQSLTLTMHGHPVTLTHKEFDLALYFFQNPGKLLSRDHLLSKIWGVNADIDTRTVDTHVCRVRKKLNLDGQATWKLISIYRVGYRFDPVESAVAA